LYAALFWGGGGHRNAGVQALEGFVVAVSDFAANGGGVDGMRLCLAGHRGQRSGCGGALEEGAAIGWLTFALVGVRRIGHETLPAAGFCSIEAGRTIRPLQIPSQELPRASGPAIDRSCSLEPRPR